MLTDYFAKSADSPRSDDFRKRNCVIASRLAQANYKTLREKGFSSASSARFCKTTTTEISVSITLQLLYTEQRDAENCGHLLTCSKVCIDITISI